ncbi:MAG: hypothetical protein ACXABO_04775 [Promethearchaeota archaeon]|jgi:hypothetical protein
MKLFSNEMERDAILTHLIFVFTCVLIIVIPIRIEIGVKLFLLIIIYNLLIVFAAFWRGHKEWINIWIFVFAISFFQI